jgi:ATP-dependent Clp protease ATP-binding subunit ClpX
MRFKLDELPKSVVLKISPTNKDMIKPSSLINHLDKFVIGQEEAKKALSIVAANYLAIRQINEEIGENGHPLKQQNILLTGTTGTGKTLLVNTLSKYLDVPYVSVDATHFSPTGYKGNDVNSMLHSVIDTCTTHSSARGLNYLSAIVLIDEIDKICGAGNSDGFNTTQIQRELLRMVEGGVVTLEGKQGSTPMSIDTRNILWVFCGSFSSITEDHKKKVAEPQVGFLNNRVVKDPEFDHDALIKYGMMPELVGRISTIAKLTKLDRADFKKILLESSASPLDAVLRVAEVRGLDVSFSDSEIDEIIDSAYSMGTGARALKTLVDKIAFNKLYN